MTAFYVEKDDSRLNEVFITIDQNGNGTIDKNELQSVMTQISGERVSEEEVNEMIAEADTNGDGVISMTEFVDVMKKHRDS